MAVTELARVRLAPDVSIENAELKRRLHIAKTAMESFTGNTFYVYADILSPSFVYIVGHWASTEQHLDEWIPSEANQTLLDLLKDYLTVDWMFHIDEDPTKIPVDAPILEISRYFVPQSDADVFSGALDSLRTSAAADRGLREEPIGGWRVEKGENDQQQEWLLFSWRDKFISPQDTLVAPSEGFRRLQTAAESLEVTHCERLSL